MRNPAMQLLKRGGSPPLHAGPEAPAIGCCPKSTVELPQGDTPPARLSI